MTTTSKNTPMNAPKTPCIGICSTTSFGDNVCRGCKRYAAEVIAWNSYDAAAKSAVLRRIEKLNTQILENKLRIFSLADLKAGLRRCHVPYDETLSPFCWLHNLLKKSHNQIGSLEEVGVHALAQYRAVSLADLCTQIEHELLQLSDAHYQRYVGLSGEQHGA